MSNSAEIATDWAMLEKENGPFVIINGTSEGYRGIYRPINAGNPLNAGLHVPETGSAVLVIIPAIGTKFNPAEEMGHQSQKVKLPVSQTGTAYLRF